MEERADQPNQLCRNKQTKKADFLQSDHSQVIFLRVNVGGEKTQWCFSSFSGYKLSKGSEDDLLFFISLKRRPKVDLKWRRYMNSIQKICFPSTPEHITFAVLYFPHSIICSKTRKTHLQSMTPRLYPLFQANISILLDIFPMHLRLQICKVT